MSEAFEIGISLALADGVSEGIAKAERDAAAAGRAAGVGALAVQRLQEAGVAALTVMGSMTRMSKSGTPAEVTRGAPAEVAPAGAAGGGAAAPTPARAPTAEDRFDPLSAAPVVAPPMPPLAPISAPVRVPESVAPTGSVSRDAREAVAAPVGRVDVTHEVRLDRGTAEAAPQGIVARPILGERQAAVSPGEAARPPSRVAPSGVVSGGGRAAPVSAGAPSPVGATLRLDHYASQGAEGFAPARPETFNPDDGNTQRPAAQAGPPPAAVRAHPLAPVFVDAAQPGGVAQPGPALGSAVAPTGAEASSAGSSATAGPMQGDVFLDGALVGRWMSRHLSREAGRASAGPTGFDSRRNALLPGATVGG
jgi:hypothetical protein